ncbi:MAG: hypothetical protein F6K55_03150 [Moorea sp. SIO4A3]|nr:hypothetical protein [Moorena sp. SIO4A3]
MNQSIKWTVELTNAITRLVTENINGEVKQEAKIELATAILQSRGYANAIGMNQYIGTKEEPNHPVHLRVMAMSIHNVCNQCDCMENRHRLPREGYGRLRFKLSVLIQKNEKLLPFMSIAQRTISVYQQKANKQQKEVTLTTSWNYWN